MIDLVGLDGMDDRYPGRAVRRHAAARRPGPRARRSTPKSCSSTSRSAPSTRSSGATCRTRSSGSTTRSARPMVFITHDLAEALQLGDRIADHARRRDRPDRAARRRSSARPADDYVADFVRDVPKSHVLTLRWIMRDATRRTTRSMARSSRPTRSSGPPSTPWPQRESRSASSKTGGCSGSSTVRSILAGDRRRRRATHDRDPPARSTTRAGPARASKRALFVGARRGRGRWPTSCSTASGRSRTTTTPALHGPQRGPRLDRRQSQPILDADPERHQRPRRRLRRR